MSRGMLRAMQRKLYPCCVYWGSHACKKRAHHLSIHICGCGSCYIPKEWRENGYAPPFGEHAYGPWPIGMYGVE